MVNFLYRNIFILFLLLSLSSLVHSGPNDWPQWRGQNHDSKAIDSGVFEKGHGLKVSWKKTLGSGYSSISIADGHAVTMFSDSTFDNVISFNAETGAENWRYQIDSTHQVNSPSYWGPLSTPVINDGNVYGFGPKGQLFSVDLKSGKENWKINIASEYDAVRPSWGFTTSPIVYDDVLILETGAESKTISGFDKKAGKMLWSAGTDTVVYHSPIITNIDDKDQLVCVSSKYLYGLNPKDGTKYWEYFHNSGSASLSPVAMGANRLLLTYAFNGRQTEALEIKKEGNSYKLSELWKSREAGRTWSSTVYHEGNLYGYTARFTVSINAETGKLNWKSRIPGDGFMVLVDGHLVTVTKAGTVHLAKASPDSYEELASVDALGSLTWTPPSFAYGKIFVRSLRDIAAIDIVPTDQMVTEKKVEQQMWLPESGFAKWVEKVEKADNKEQLVAEFLSNHNASPYIEDKKYAHVFYYGEAKDLVIRSDVLDTQMDVAMNHIKGTDFYYASFELKSDARVDYMFTKDFGPGMTDPLNPVVVPGYFGDMSQIAMPDWKKPTHFDEPMHAKRGSLDSLNFDSKVLENSRTVKVYLPAGYKKGSQRYATVYVNNGQEYIEDAKSQNTLDNLIGKSIEPVIAVFIYGPHDFPEYARTGRDKYAEAVAKELVPMIDRKYRTIAKQKARAFFGGDEGGYAALNTAFQYSDLFGMVGGQSTHLLLGHGGEEILKLIKDSDKLNLGFYLDWGSYDARRQDQYSYKTNNEDLVKLLEEKGYTWTGGEYPEGFGYSSWRNRTDKVLEAFFPLKKTQK